MRKLYTLYQEAWNSEHAARPGSQTPITLNLSQPKHKINLQPKPMEQGSASLNLATAGSNSKTQIFKNHMLNLIEQELEKLDGNGD